MYNSCCVFGCSMNWGKFYRIPTATNHCHLTEKNTLTAERRRLWLSAIRRADLTEDTPEKVKNARVCSAHFISGKPAAHEDLKNPDWVPSQNMGYGHEAMVDELTFEERKKYLSVKRCTVCFESLSPEVSVEVCGETGLYTQFGCILHAVLKFSDSNFRTRFCCEQCSSEVAQCFNSLLELNIATLLAKQRTSDNTLEYVLEEGCPKCAAVFQSCEEFTEHYLQHFYSSFEDKRAVLDNYNDVFDVVEDMKIEVAPVKVKKPSEKRKLEKKRLVTRKIPENSGPSTTEEDESQVLRRLAEMASGKSIKTEIKTEENLDQDSLKEIQSEHCYGRDEVVDSIELVDSEEKEEMRKRRNLLIKKLVAKEVEVKTNESRVCDLCGTLLKTKISIRNHMMRHKKNPNFPCMQRKRLKNEKTKRPRKIENLESNPILCPKCGMVFKENFEIVTHMVMMHNADRKECIKMQKRYRLWPCSVCKQTFVNKRDLQKHIDKDHDGLSSDLRVQCEPCGRWYKNSKQLFQHIMLKHAEMFPHMCSICQKPFINERNLIKHVARHNEIIQAEAVVTKPEKGEAEEVVEESQVQSVQLDDCPDPNLNEPMPDVGNSKDDAYETYLFYMPGETSGMDSQELTNYTFMIKNSLIDE